MTGALQIIPVTGIGEVADGDHVAHHIAEHATVKGGDVVVVASKVVAKAEGRVVAIAADDAEGRAGLIEGESVRVLRRRGPLVITETPQGFICANAGVDWSNVEPGKAVLLPKDPDRSARRIRDGLRAIFGAEVAVIVSDTFGRTWREGVIDVALGCAGLRPIMDLRDTVDAYGNTLHTTQVCIADELAGAAELVMGKTAQVPVAIVRGVDPTWLGQGSIRSDVVRKPHNDLFR